MKHLNTRHGKNLVRKTVSRGQQYPSPIFRIEFEHALNEKLNVGYEYIQLYYSYAL